MTNRRLHRCFGALLAILAVWPLLQFAFTEQVGGTPWKLFGLAMYSTIHNTEVHLSDHSRGAAEAIALEGLSTEARAAVTQFRQNRRVFGSLAEPSAAAARVLQERPDVSVLVFDVRLRHLDAKSSRLKTEHTEFRFERDQLL